ncbi:MAG: hypothetical protein ACREL3_12315, partial [Gemmatimonadales bacterium]
MSYAPQSSPGLLRLPACLLVCLALATTASAQREDALTAPANLHREPEGTPLVSLPAGAPVETGEARGDWKQATIEGWVYTPSTAPTRRDGFDLIVTPGKGENLRSSPNGPVVGRVREGTLLERIDSKGKWTLVRRAGWLPTKAVRSRGRRLQVETPAAKTAPPPAKAASSSAQAKPST